jgi:hypothetical protein
MNNYSQKQIFNELWLYALEQLEEKRNHDADYDLEDLHQDIFNSDYYIIGYWEAEQWLKSHEVSVFEGIDFCNEMYEIHFGESASKFSNAEQLVNNIVYWIGQEVCQDIIQNEEK